MASYKVTDFSDIVSMVMEELKLQANDLTSKNRIKRDINAVYLDEVVPFKRWKWLSGHTEIEFKPYYGAGTASVLPDSTTVTLSTIVPLAMGSVANYYFATDSFSEVYRISAHTAGTAILTLSTPYTSFVNTAAKFKIWTDRVNLPTDCRETVEVWHDFYAKTMDPVGLQELRRLVKEGTRNEGRPEIYTTYDYYDPSSGDGEHESDRYRLMLVHPSVYQNSTTIHVDYTKEAEALDLDGDEPLMPVEDRIVLVYGALHRAWSRERNPEEGQRNYQLFQNKLGQMAGKLEDSFDTPTLGPSNKYITRMRGKRIKGQSRRLLSSTSGGGSSYSAPTYLSGATINGATVTANVIVNTGITIDGRDISADGASLDSHIAASADVHGIGASSDVVGTETAQTLLNKNLDDATTAFVDSGDVTKRVEVSVGGVTASKSTLQFAQTADRTIVFQDASGTIVLLDSTDTLTNKTIDAASNALSNISDAEIKTGAAIAYSKLALTGSLVDADISASSAIAYSKLALAASVVDADIASGAAITRAKLASGTADHVVINDPSGVLSSEAQLAISRGGTGQATASAAFDALSPMTTDGDLIYGGASGTGTRLPIGSDTQVLTLVAGLPAWATSGASITNNYFNGYLQQNASNDWATSSAAFAALAPTGTATLTTRQSSGIVATAAAADAAGITFTPSSATAVYLVTATTNINNLTAGAGMAVRLFDGTVEVGTSPSYTNGVAHYNSITVSGVYVPGTGSAVTLSLQGITNTGTVRAGLSSGAVPGWYGIEWNIVQIKN